MCKDRKQMQDDLLAERDTAVQLAAYIAKLEGCNTLSIEGALRVSAIVRDARNRVTGQGGHSGTGDLRDWRPPQRSPQPVTLAEARIMRGLSLNSLVKRADLTAAEFARIERNPLHMGYEEWKRLSIALDMSPEDVWWFASGAAQPARGEQRASA